MNYQEKRDADEWLCARKKKERKKERKIKKSTMASQSDSTVYDLAYFADHGVGGALFPLTGLGAGDSCLYLDVLSPELQKELFETLDAETEWNVMTHRGGPVPRLLSIQAEPREGNVFPLYRHPADEQPGTVPFTSTTAKCRDEVSRVLAAAEAPQHYFNHALVQKYRSGADNISEHADKTLDIARDTAIVNLSVGSTRVMILRSKPDHPGTTAEHSKKQETTPKKIVQKITLPPNSVFVLGWQTNRLFTHQIKADKRPLSEKRPDERLYDGQRISITFRSIATYLSPDGVVTGQGARKSADVAVLGNDQEKAKEEAEEKESDESNELLNAFSAENRSALFDWDASYGPGFNVVNFRVT